METWNKPDYVIACRGCRAGPLMNLRVPVVCSCGMLRPGKRHISLRVDSGLPFQLCNDK